MWNMFLQFIEKAKKRKCLVSGYPTHPYILVPSQTFLKTFWILMSIFRLSLRILYLKKVCLPTCTDPKIFGHVIGSKAYFSFGLRVPNNLDPDPV